MSAERVREYYKSFAHGERDRLTRSTSGRIEMAVNLHFIRQHLLPASRILDLGGATGAYTLALATDGHSIVLADLSPDLLSLAREEIARSPVRQRVEDICEADARDLSSLGDHSFDAVLALGPFYHLLSQDDRVRAANELARVLRPSGHAFVAYMPRTTLLRYRLQMAASMGAVEADVLSRALAEGAYTGTRPGRFTEAYYPVPSEMQSLLSRVGITTVRTVASEGIAAALDESSLDVWSDGDAFEELLSVCVQTAEEPSLVGATTHMLLIGRNAPPRRNP